jgi:hypothetical protein
MGNLKFESGEEGPLSVVTLRHMLPNIYDYDTGKAHDPR